jgi:membrane protein YdbS with pleckstrin-like domain
MARREVTDRKLTARLARLVLITCLLLLIPLVVMQFNSDVDWDGTDFIAAGTLILLTGLVYELVIARLSWRRKMIAIGFLVILFIYIWAELAVGIFTNLGS